ncbi:MULTISPECIES: ribonuclease III [Gordonia]|uniref:Ribonuclease 3 n=2 Tax=Gordonia alkanivorans TaxID=84096 RepID=F9VT41_9ACTN|nr:MULTISPECIES: ribonuclease III [Gordonia]AZZ81899.1 ribonuclease III [Gordonia alkanivorans]ETA08062.1 ribonuclease III [Gordonia alkanivorans CGMCC 6845]MDH3006316.1 ribonuclease III [Gordonia alkanivorans]MDH3018822.1 ribonuclease III [Gordonia alkanivorans]MDH3025513.1 ribonuclease III [Gordonia alkanivorans]
MTESTREEGRRALLAALDTDIPEDLLTLALTHRSYAYEHGGLPTNERLEFLGDSVLGVVITERLYLHFPDRPEGELAKIRASVVNMHALADVARGLGDEGGLGKYLYLGRGEEMTGGRDKDSILADGLESLFGAVFLSHGLETSQRIILRLFDERIEKAGQLGAGLDWKTSLQELSSERGYGPPQYQISSTGPDHNKEFTAIAMIAGENLGEGVGRTKKEAEQQAAAHAWKALTERAEASS